MEDFFSKYFVEPILNREGYNLINTSVYALIAIIFLIIIFNALKKFNVSIDKNFTLGVLAFTLFGSTVRVITDAIDSDALNPENFFHSLILSSNIYNYSFFTSSPGIYILTSLLFFIFLFVGKIVNRMEVVFFAGILIWLPHFVALSYIFKYYIILIVAALFAFIPFYLAFNYFKENKFFYSGIVFSHALDGSATFLIIEVFSGLTQKFYEEQHVVPGIIKEIFGTFFAFYVIKVVLAFFAAYLIEREKISEEEKKFISLALIVLGLAPAIRNIFRAMGGV